MNTSTVLYHTFSNVSLANFGHCLWLHGLMSINYFSSNLGQARVSSIILDTTIDDVPNTRIASIPAIAFLLYFIEFPILNEMIICICETHNKIK